MAESSASEEQDDLVERLYNHLSTSEFDNNSRKFMPEGVLDCIIKRKSILEAMGIENPNADDDQLVKFILENAKKIFATSVSIKLKLLQRAMLLFKENNIHDGKLPFDDTPDSILASLEPSVGRHRQKKIWTPSTIHNFCSDQWKFLTPVFSTDSKTDIDKYDLPISTIIPFIEKHADFEKGSFGKVSKYEIHPNHIKDPLRPGVPCPTIVAVKEILPGDNEDREQVTTHWESEIKALERMNELDQDHIVRFITAFRRCRKDGKDHYLMFEWADGNLRNLWEETPQPTLSTALVKSAIQQLFGLAEALSAAHYLKNPGASYRHGDLKPANILRFDDGSVIGKLKIGDWGEAKEHNIVTEFRFNNTTAAYATWRYAAPEIQTGVNPRFLNQSKKRRSRLYDIWAMGCITLEFMIWLLYGLEGLNKFNQEFPDDSPFYQISDESGERIARVHSAAIWWMKHMAAEPICNIDTALGRLLELVRDGLLVVKLPRRTGSNLRMGSESSNLAMGSNLAICSEQLPVTNASTQSASEGINNDSDSLALQSLAGSPEAPMPNIPSINITPAESGRIPVEPKPEPPGPARLLAVDFKGRLEEIILYENDDESYWFTDKPRSFPPADPNSSYIHNSETSQSMWLSGPMSVGQAASESLMTPEEERV